MPGIDPNLLVITHLILTAALGGKYYCFLFGRQENQDTEQLMCCPRSPAGLGQSEESNTLQFDLQLTYSLSFWIPVKNIIFLNFIIGKFNHPRGMLAFHRNKPLKANFVHFEETKKSLSEILLLWKTRKFIEEWRLVTTICKAKWTAISWWAKCTGV